MTQAPKVLIVDDHPVVAEGWGRIIRDRFGAEIAAADSPRRAWAAWRAARPDVIVLDLSLGVFKTGGLRFLARLRRADPGLPVLVFTMHRSPVLARRALDLGAQGIVHKDSPTDELCAAFAAVAAGGRHVAPDLAAQLDAQRPGDRPRLTPREAALLAELAKGASYREIGQTLGISYKTVANMSLSLKDKLGADSLAALVVRGQRWLEGE